MFTQELLKEFFNYKDGNLYWKVDRRQLKLIGKKAGSKLKNGYEHIQVCGKYIYTHRAIFLYHYGYLPKILDHINGNPSDNRIENLREVTSAQNSWNRKILIGASGVRGITWDKAERKWLAQLKANNKKIWIGRYKSKDDAEQAYKKTLEIYHGVYTRKD
jgi:hypothetical protein